MGALLALMPAAWQPYAKAVIAVVSALLAVAAQVLPFLADDVAAAVTSVVAVLGALGVYATPNIPSLEMPDVDPEPED